MPGTTNFVQVNPSAANQQSDGTYDSYSLTTGGVGTNDILPSPWLNKVWFQTSTFIKALAAAIAAFGPGYTITDTSVASLQTQFTNFFNTLLQFATVSIVTGSRAFGTQYQNTGNTPMLICVTGNQTWSVGNNGSVLAKIGPSSANEQVAANSISNGPGYASVTFAVPPGFYYEVTTNVGTDTGALVLSSWAEYV